jgi:hypothetical protein
MDKDMKDSYLREIGRLTTYFILTIVITGFLDFVHRPVLERTQWFAKCKMEKVQKKH